MIVLGLSATLIATLTLAAISMLLNIEEDRKSMNSRVFPTPGWACSCGAPGRCYALPSRKDSECR